MSNVVLVVDMVRGFLEPGHNLYCGDDARKIIPNVRELLDRERQAGSSVLFISDHHDPDDLEFRMFPVHCVKGTEETDVVPELAG
ncbi:MAG: isochorismatase family protein, partial [Dehalococcoidia bacterium]|nr:isochorismatase family protein [Dehalococcoidia bacterium]